MSGETVLTNEDIRRFYMEDFEWERTSESWKLLIPKRNFNTFDINDESEEEHRDRLLPRFDIPLEVIEQWLYPLYYNQNSTNNYGWLNYDRVEFLKKELDYETLSKVNVIEDYKFHVDEGAQYLAYEKIPCSDRDREYWIKNGTWRTPPLILDVQSLENEEIPGFAEIKGLLQIIEGHSRLGYLYAARNCGVLSKERHSVYIMRYKQKGSRRTGSGLTIYTRNANVRPDLNGTYLTPKLK